MNSRERFMSVLDLEMPDRVPFADWIDPGMAEKLAKAMGREEMDDAELAKGLGMDAIGFQEMYNIAPVCDVTKKDANGRTYYLGQGLIKTEKDLALLTFPDPHQEGLYDEAKRFVDRYGQDDLALYCGIRPGIQPTYLSLGWMRFAESVVKGDRMIEAIYDPYIEWNCTVVEKLQAIGFDFLVLYEDIAHGTGPLFSPRVYRERFLPKFKTLTDLIRIPWVYHSDGDLSTVLDDLLLLGMNAINPIEPTAMDINEVKKKYGDRVVLWGNIDMVHTLYDGTLEEVDEEVRKRVRDIGEGGGYICGSANSIADYLKVENVLEMGRAIKKYGKYPLDLG
jgi:Uroporphyrinogen decarboxylase (URO-D)